MKKLFPTVEATYVTVLLACLTALPGMAASHDFAAIEDSDSSLLEINVLEGGGRVAYSNDFSSGSGTLGSINGWTGQGAEDKDYNVSGSGMLIIQEQNGDEKGAGIHAGYFDSVYSSMSGAVGLSNVGDWIRLSLDFEVFPGSYGGGSVADDTGGLRISLVDSAASANAGFGIYIGTGTASTHTYQEMRVAASAQSSSGVALSGVDIPEDSGLKSLVLLLTRMDGGVQLSGELAGHTLTVHTNSNMTIVDKLFDRLTVSVGAKDHGVRIDNVLVEAPEAPGLWDQYVAAKAAGTEPILPDYSHAGYALGETGIPAAAGDVFNVADYGAIANDGLSDRAAIEAAILAAANNGGGIVFFPPGVFNVNETVGTAAGIDIHGEHIVLQGSGSGPGGTEIFMKENMDNKTMFAFSPPAYPLQNRTTITADSTRETYSITVVNASALQPEMLLELTMGPNTNANAEFLDGLEPWDIWTTTVNSGVFVRGERHRIKSIVGNTVTFYEPIHCNIIASHGWSVRSSAFIRGWGVEDIHFRGNWQDTFVHHQNDTVDYGWQLVSFFYGDSPYLRRCRFTDVSSAATISACYAGTILNCSIEGNQGHSSFASAYYSYGTLMAYCADMVSNGAFHGFGANAGSVGTVITHCKNSNRGFDWHASWPYCTLLDACSGGLIGNGGNVVVLPNHMRHLTVWNFNQTAGTVYNQYDWWEPRVGTEQYSGAKVVRPIIAGYHGLGTTFKSASCQIIESQGTPVAQASLYDSQLEWRLGTLPVWLDEARARYDFFMTNGYWPSEPYAQLLYNEWSAGYGLTGSGMEYAADPDADYRGNLFEYGVGGIPTPGTNSPTELPGFGMIEDGGFRGLEYIYNRRRNAAARGLTYTVERADNLLSNLWTTTGVVGAGSRVIDDDFESVTNRVSMAGTTNGFVRLQVEMSQ